MSQSAQQRVLLQGVLTASDGKILPGASLTLKETDSGQIITLTTSSSAAYSFFVQPGTWCVTVQQPDDTPRNIGVLSVNAATKDGALNDLLTALTPSSLDMSVLGFMRGLVSEAERATESINLNQSAIDQNLKDSEILATQTKQAAQDAQQALEEAKLIAKTPGKDGAPGQPGHDGKSAYEIWKENQPAGADTSMTAYLAIYADVKNLRSTNIGGKSVPFILVKQIKQITDLPTGTFVEVQSTTGLLPLIDTAYLSVIANNFGSNKNVFVLYGNGSGRVWTGYRNGAAVDWKELGGSGGGASLAGIKPGEVGSIILGSRNDNGAVLAGQDIDGQSVQNPCLRWEGEYGQELKLIATPREGYVGTWTALQNTGASGIGLFVRKR
ncbi:prophage tail fiber N-terminal domain-containing protein [Salmonella enterica]|nr:prophage tail fiber N-terminal domain-containing protein [Salmonella enterica]